MRLSKDKMYSIVRYCDDAETVNYGPGYTGKEVRSIIGSAKYDEEYGMFFSANGKYGYDVKEC